MVRTVRRGTYDFDWFKVHWQPGYGWIVDRSPAVVVIAAAPDDGLWLERIARPPTGRSSWETPAGGVDEKEDAVTAGLRELEEECGLIAKSGARQLGTPFEVVPGMGRFPHYVVLAFDVVPIGKRPVAQRSEGIRGVRKFDRASVRSMLQTRRINVFPTLAALLLSGWLDGGMRRVRSG